jgi:alkane 1-monooxygenase
MAALRFAGPFVFALSVPALYYLVDPHAPVLAVVALLAALIGAELLSLRGGIAPQAEASQQWLPVLFVPVQLGILAWAIAIAGDLDRWSFLSLAFALGVTTGVFGVLAAHELVHGRARRARQLGLAMLTAMSYRHFRIAHVHGHHRWAATARDPATAGLGEGFYRFLFRTVPGQFAQAWTIERRRTATRGFFANRVTRDAIAMAVVYGAIALLAGPAGLGLFVAQCAVGIVVLELFNYIAHYGLTRRPDPAGHEPLGDRHSWNSSNILANHLIFNMGRHSAHHRRPAASFAALDWRAGAPELPAGYAGSILLALVPPLWRRIMDPEVQRLHTGAGIAPG